MVTISRRLELPFCVCCDGCFVKSNHFELKRETRTLLTNLQEPQPQQLGHQDRCPVYRRPLVGTVVRTTPNTASSRRPNPNNEHKFRCARYSKLFKTRPGLNMHMQSHAGKRAFWCETCERCFTVKCNYTARRQNLPL